MILLPSPPHRSRRLMCVQAFTLVEMLTVVGIIAMLVALVTPALVDVIRSTRLSSSGDSLQNRLSLAQQSAVSKSTETEMRFYKYIDADADRPSTPLFYAYQVVETPNGGSPRAISEVYYFDSGIVLTANPKHSPLLQTLTPQQPDANRNFIFVPPTGATGDSVKYAALRFYADGSCRRLNNEAPGASAAATAMAYTVPPLKDSFLTLVESRTLDSQTTPANFYCMQIDSYTGKVRVYRP
jgi:uncharacterized protein (TIGR02596 family)